MARLRRVDCSEPGIRRVPHGRGFRYLESDGTPIRDREVLERVRDLAIPPAWEEVWICPHPRGHIQATGYDKAGRKQYLYHARWRERQDQLKFDNVLGFAGQLPALRKELERGLGKSGLVRARVLACALRLLDLGLFRVGSEQYAAENETYGLTTLRKGHLRLERGQAVFDYRAKGGQRQMREIADSLSLPTLRALKARRAGGHRLFAYRNGRRWVPLRSDEINDHLKEIAGGDYSAKDFRTWNATVLAAVAIAAHDPKGSKAARRRAIGEAVERVATYLSNTPAVCRSAYIDPRVFDRFDSGDTIRGALDEIVAEPDPGSFPDRERIEAAVLELIDG